MTDKDLLLLYMRENCYGVACAKKRAEILQSFGWTDRKLRRVFSELVHERHCISDSMRGYWMIPASCSRREAEAVIGAIRERKAKALDMLTGLKAFELEILSVRAREEDKEYLVSIVDGQMSFMGV